MRRHVNDHELILSWDSELSWQRQSEVTRHLETCGRCREQADRLRSAMTSVATLYTATREASSPAAGYRRVRLESALRQAEAAPPSGSVARSATVQALSLMRGVAIAVVAVALCATAFMTVRAARGQGLTSTGRGMLPESSLTPGAVSHLTAAELCNGVRPSRLVTENVRQQVLRAYGMQGVSAEAYELDALVTPELGGSTDAANLWPQRYQSPIWNARVKDELEELLPRLVCSDQMTLADAQREIATDWVAAYKRHFDTELPLRAHTIGTVDEDEELVFVADQPAMTRVAALALVSR